MNTVFQPYHKFPAKILLLLAIIMLSAGCEKVINVDLNEAAPRIVIEGLINNGSGPYYVRLSRSGSYFGGTALQGVTGALVVITDNTGITDTLPERSAGLYQTIKTRGIPGRTYILTVNTGNITYTGQSSMPHHVRIDSLSLVRTEVSHISIGGNSSKETALYVYCYFSDPPGKNFYRARVFTNDSTDTQRYHLFDDQYTDGEETELRVAHVEQGDKVKVDLYSLDKSTYAYYRTLEDLIYSNPVFGSTPANPDSNIDNGALGYFGACAISSKTIIIGGPAVK
ncbi:MAG TPA: DUF4249 domain-containing protein [Bacteroidales bacterium]|nr:DUF4249 domain-containing protein [Bacteroidales bacterium]